MITFTDVSFGYPKKDLYDKINFCIEDGEHVVVIGSNGTGKTSLLNLILDESKFTYEGLIRKENSSRIGLVSQFVKHEDDDISVFDYLAKPFVQMQAESDAICAEMEKGENLDQVYERYQECLDRMDAADAYNHPFNIKKQLSVAGVPQLENMPVNKISGGEFKLLSIVRAMLLRPNVLILDEPDVFLDFENVIGLSKLINGYDGTIIAVTHNRLLLNSCFNKVLHIENEELQEFPGSFAEYNNAMLDTKISMQENFSKFEDFIQVQLVNIEKLRKVAETLSEPKRGRQLRARVSYLERLYKKRGENPFIEERHYNFAFPYKHGENAAEEDAERPEIDVCDYSLVYDRQILRNVNFVLKKGEKAAIVGANGTGKSSLLRDIYNSMKAEGRAVGYFSQIYDGDNSEKLSGGEQNIKMIRELCNEETEVLFLDEPTSHLDIYAQAALEKAINEYEGTVLMVSHDFFLINNCADKVLVLEDGTMRETSPRSYRKSVYKKYYTSDIFEQEKLRKDREMQINRLLSQNKYEEARALLGEV